MGAVPSDGNTDSVSQGEAHAPDKLSIQAHGKKGRVLYHLYAQSGLSHGKVAWVHGVYFSDLPQCPQGSQTPFLATQPHMQRLVPGLSLCSVVSSAPGPQHPFIR